MIILVPIGLALLALFGNSKSAPAPVAVTAAPEVAPVNGLAFGDVTGVPESFDPKSNNVYISQDCSGVLVGERFWPDADVVAEDAPTLQETLAIPGNSVVGFVIYLMETEDLREPEKIAARIMVELRSTCRMTSAYRAFFEWLKVRITPYVQEWGRV